LIALPQVVKKIILVNNKDLLPYAGNMYNGAVTAVEVGDKTCRQHLAAGR
jgi:hypothetical protein